MSASRRNALCIIAGVTFLFAAGINFSGLLVAEDRGATVGGDGSEDARHKEVEDYVNEFDKLFGISAGVDGGWSFIEKETKVEGNGWCDPQKSPGIATPTQSHSEKAIPDSQKEPENFSVKLHGKLTKPGGEGQPPAWSVSGKTDFFWIEAVSPADTDGDRTVYVGYGSEAKFEAKGDGSLSQTKWKMRPNPENGQNNIPDNLYNGEVTGASLTVPVIGKDEKNPIAAGEYTISAEKDENHKDTMTLVIVQLDLDHVSKSVKDEEECGDESVIVMLNNDNDNNNDKPDLEDTGPVTDENDLFQIVVRRPYPDVETGTFTITLSDNIKLYEDSLKKIAAKTEPYNFADIPSNGKTFWVEGIKVSGSLLDVSVKISANFTDYNVISKDEIKFTVAFVEKIRASSKKADNSPQDFPGHKEWPFDPNVSPPTDPGKHLVIFYKKVVKKDFSVKDFDVDIKAFVMPLALDPDGLDETWKKEFGPDSGALDKTDTFEVKFQNPKQGGIYKFSFDLCPQLRIPKSEANVVLPLAGAEIKDIVRGNLAQADAFAKLVKAKYNYWSIQRPSNGLRWFVIAGAGDYLGRPNNATSPTVRKYNQVSSNGMGAVATWFGVPIRVSKASNFIVAYGAHKIGVNPVFAWISQVVGTFNDKAASESWDAGWKVADGAKYDATVSTLVKEVFDKADDKNQKLWPNSATPDNYVTRASWTDPDTEFSPPGFLEMTSP